MTAYNAFIKERLTGCQAEPQNEMKKAGAEWNNMSEDEKANYKKKAARKSSSRKTVAKKAADKKKKQ